MSLLVSEPSNTGLASGPVIQRTINQAPAPAPASGSPEYTEWYYNNPSGPGYVSNRDTVVEVDRSSGLVSVVNVQDGSRVVTGSVRPTLADAGSDIKLADNKYINADLFNRLPDDVKQAGLTEGSLAMTDRMIKKAVYQGKQEQFEQEDIERARGQLKPFLVSSSKQVNPVTGASRGGENYDIAAALRSGIDAETIKAAGFSQEDIKRAELFNRETRGINERDYVDLSQYTKDYFKLKGWKYGPESDVTGKEYQKRLDEAKSVHSMLYTPRVSEKEFITNILADKGIDYVKLNKNLNNLDRPWTDEDKAGRKAILEARSLYIKKYGVGARVLTEIGDMASLVFTPARVIKPEVTLADLNSGDLVAGAIDLALIFAPGKVIQIAGKIKNASTAAKVSKAITNEADHMIQGIGATNPELVEPLTKLSQAQADYAKSVITEQKALKAYEAVNKGKPYTGQKMNYTGQISDLDEARAALDKSRAALRSAAQDYAGVVEATNKIKFDDPGLKEGFKRMPDDIIKHTNDVIKDVQNAKVKTIKEPAIKAQETYYKRLDQYNDAYKTLNQVKPGSEVYAGRLESFRKAQDALNKAEELYTKELNKLNIDVKVRTKESGGKIIRTEEPGIFDSGNVATRVKPQPRTRRGSNLDIELSKAGQKKPIMAEFGTAGGSSSGPQRMTAEQAAREARARGEDTEIVYAVSNKTITGTFASTNTSPGDQTAPQTSTNPDTGAKSDTSGQTGTDTGTDTETAPETKPQSKTGTATQTRTRTRLTTKTKVTRGKGIVDLNDKKNKAEKVVLKKGSFAYEQGALKAGEVVKYGEPPDYKVKIMVGKYPAGYQDTGDTPRETIQTIGGPVTKDLDINTGVTTAHLRANATKITFTANKVRTFDSSTRAWKQGVGWWIWKAPYGEKDREFVLEKPQGATILADARTAFNMVRSQGGAAAVDPGVEPAPRPERVRKPSRSADPVKIAREKQAAHGGGGKRVGPYHYRNGAMSRKPL